MAFIASGLFSLLICAIVVVVMIYNALEIDDNQRLDAMLREHGYKFRRPTNKWQKFWLLTSCNSQWTRRMLGGKWESYIHDIGTWHAIITWHWVEDFHAKEKDTSLPLFRTEDYTRFNTTKR